MTYSSAESNTGMGVMRKEQLEETKPLGATLTLLCFCFCLVNARRWRLQQKRMQPTVGELAERLVSKLKRFLSHLSSTSSADL